MNTQINNTCPNCGYCPHCRRPQPFYPAYVPYMPTYPAWPSNGYITWGGSLGYAQGGYVSNSGKTQ